jgi:hypothetical protein
MEIAKGHNGARHSPFCKTLESRNIKVIIMVVGDQHSIKRRKVFKTDTGLTVPLGAYP